MLTRMPTESNSSADPSPDENTSFEEFESYLVCRYGGVFVYEPLIDLAREVNSECIRRGIHAALVDVTGSKGDLTVIERFDHGCEVASFWDRRNRMAVVGRAEHLLPDRFWETVTRNRGVRSFVTTERDEAIEWLRSEAH